MPCNLCYICVDSGFRFPACPSLWLCMFLMDSIEWCTSVYIVYIWCSFTLVHRVIWLLYVCSQFLFPLPFPWFFPCLLCWGFRELAGVSVGVLLFSLLATLALVLCSNSSSVLWVNSVHSCLSVSPKLGFLNLVFKLLAVVSILAIISLFVLIATASRQRPASLSAFHHFCICSWSGFVPGKDSLILIWNAFGTTSLHFPHEGSWVWPS